MLSSSSSSPSSMVAGQYLSSRSKLSFSLMNQANSTARRNYVKCICKETKTTRKLLETRSGIHDSMDLDLNLGTAYYQMNAWIRGATENPAVEKILLKWAISVDPRPELRNAQGEIQRKGKQKPKTKHDSSSSSSAAAAAAAAAAGGRSRKKKQRVLLTTIVYASEEEEEKEYADDEGELLMPANVITEATAIWPGAERDWSFSDL